MKQTFSHFSNAPKNSHRRFACKSQNTTEHIWYVHSPKMIQVWLECLITSSQTCLLPNASHDYLEVYWTHCLEVCRVAGAWREGVEWGWGERVRAGACIKFLVTGSNGISTMHLLLANRQATHLQCVRTITVAATATEFSVDSQVFTNLHRRRYILLTKAAITNTTEYEEENNDIHQYTYRGAD
jgi:hypothetical protein